MDDRHPSEPASDQFPLLDELPAPVALLLVGLVVAVPLVMALLLAMG